MILNTNVEDIVSKNSNYFNINPFSLNNEKEFSELYNNDNNNVRKAANEEKNFHKAPKTAIQPLSNNKLRKFSLTSYANEKFDNSKNTSNDNNIITTILQKQIKEEKNLELNKNKGINNESEFPIAEDIEKNLMITKNKYFKNKKQNRFVKLILGLKRKRM